MKILIIFVLCMLLIGCGNPSIKDSGLDLQSVLTIVKSSTNAEDLETKLNAKDWVNNLDLNEDGEVDYISVTEYGDWSGKGFSLTVQNSAGEVQEVAQIQIENADGIANVAIVGNENLYERGERYEASFSNDELLMMYWLFYMTRPNYVSVYHYGNYPSTYVKYNKLDSNTYLQRMSVIRTPATRTTTTNMKSSPKSPNSGKTYSTSSRSSGSSYKGTSPSSGSRSTSSSGSRSTSSSGSRSK